VLPRAAPGGAAFDEWRAAPQNGAVPLTCNRSGSAVTILRMRLPHDGYAWVVAAASCLMMGLAFGSLITLTVFFAPLEQEFGWARGVTSFAYAAATFMTGLLGIVMGRLADRFSPRPIVLSGAVVIGTGLLLLSRVQSLWQLYLIYGLLVGGFGTGCILIPLLTNVGSWFDRHRGIAIGAVMAGQSLGGAVMPGVARALLAHLPWRETYAVLGLGAWALLIPMALLVRAPPGLAARKAASVGAAAPVAALPPAQLTAVLCMAIVCCCICMSIPIVHVYPLAVEGAFSPAQAAGVLAALMTSSIVGRVGIGRVADALGGIRALLLASGIQTAMIFWFAQVSTLPGLLLIAVLFGLGYGGVIPCYAIIIRELIPLHRVGVSTGLVFFFGNVGMALGGYLGGVFHDLSGAYPASYAAGALAGALNLVIVGALLLATRARQSAAPVPA
jgi:MFS family permease